MFPPSLGTSAIIARVRLWQVDSGLPKNRRIRMDWLRRQVALLPLGNMDALMCRRLGCNPNSENIQQVTTVLVRNWDRVPYITERNAQAQEAQKLLEISAQNESVTSQY